MLNDNMKLPQMKHIMEINEAMKPVLNMISNGYYIGEMFYIIQIIEDLQYKYENDYVFQNSDIFLNLGFLADKISISTQNGSGANPGDKEYSEMVALERKILDEYRNIMSKYQ